MDAEGAAGAACFLGEDVKMGDSSWLCFTYFGRYDDRRYH